MAFDWRILVVAPDGTAKTSITSASAVAGLDGFDFDAAGACLEGRLTALPGSVDLDPRDVINVQWSEDGFVSVKGNLYKGYITSAGSARGARLQEFRAMGLKQRAYEVVLPDLRIAGADVAVMAKAIFNTRIGPGQVVGTDVGLSALEPLGFTLGDRGPRYETAGDFLDALADAVGSFTVAPSTSYTYAGVTFAAGERVPAAAWGAGAGGLWFFHRPLNSLAVTEDATGVDVEWSARTAEEVRDRITLVYASDYNGNPASVNVGGTVVEDPVAQPLALESGTGDYAAGAVRVLDAPLDFMVDGITSTSWTPTNVLNPSNAFDGDPTTYAEFELDGPGDPPGIVRANALTALGAIAVVDLSLSGFRFFSGTTGVDLPNARITARVGTASPVTTQTRISYVFQPDEDQRIKIAIPILKEVRATLASADEVRIEVSGAGEVRLYELEVYTIDEATNARLAAAFTRLPPDESAVVTSQGLNNLVGSPSGPNSSYPTLNLTDFDGALVTLPIQRTERRVTVDRGAETIIHAGQGFDAELEAERVVLERLARRAVNTGGARR